MTKIRRNLTAIAMIALITGPGCTLLPAKRGRGADGAHQPADPGPWLGPLAQKHAGKVLFSSAPIPMDGADDSAAYATYTLGDPLFMRYWSADSPHNLQPCKFRSMSSMQTIRTILLKADVNGEGAGKPIDKLTGFGWYDVGSDDKQRLAQSLSNELEQAFTASTTYFGEKETAGLSAVRAFNTEIVGKLHDGDNTLRVVVALSCGHTAPDTIAAEGTITVKVPPGAKAAYMAKYAPKLERSPHPENDTLAREIVAAMKKLPDWDNEVFMGAQVTSEAWQPVRNRASGVLVAQEIEALLFVRLKSEKDHEKCRAFKMSYRRDPAGGTLYRAGTGDSRPFPCGLAPKS